MKDPEEEGFITLHHGYQPLLVWVVCMLVAVVSTLAFAKYLGRF